MSKVKEYHMLSKKLRDARRAMRAARGGITAYQKEYVLNELNTPICACINKFERIYGVSPSPDSYDDDGGFVVFCPLFDELPCMNIKCPMYPENLDYAVAKERFDMARSARREFVHNVLKIHSK